jgi:hypothetical protein
MRYTTTQILSYIELYMCTDSYCYLPQACADAPCTDQNLVNSAHRKRSMTLQGNCAVLAVLLTVHHRMGVLLVVISSHTVYL